MKICQGAELKFENLQRLRLINFKPNECKDIWDINTFAEKEQEYIEEYVKRKLKDTKLNKEDEKELLRKELKITFYIEPKKINHRRLKFLEKNHFKEIFTQFKLEKILKNWLFFGLLVPIYIIVIIGLNFFENILDGFEVGFAKILIDGVIYAFLSLVACWIIGFSLANYFYINFVNEYHNEMQKKDSTIENFYEKYAKDKFFKKFHLIFKEKKDSEIDVKNKILFGESIHKVYCIFGLLILIFVYLSIGILDFSDLYKLVKLSSGIFETASYFGFSALLISLVFNGFFRDYLRNFILFEYEQALLEYASCTKHNHLIDEYIEYASNEEHNHQIDECINKFYAEKIQPKEGEI
ncbi:hypothetical protein THC_0706 [Caldimicrobium thiodismutans]|uniref:Uncharacterized protein n=1 Tax=Caldimicrobium thiodismutans TaxID=1653476 RepID=A0A0U4W206_9BACT|nr:hypothetical protein [Caldimicrobium thiodismutans]BAU23098.1 hypothetical protein THC_0706 [Caldimicrobium thiodismutans]